MRYAKKGIRANAIMPGLLHTPMAIETFNYGYLESELHPGAVRAYKELGIAILDEVIKL